MPHDLQHFIVEQEFGLKHAIFGQLAEGGDAATFVKVNSGATGRKAARQKRRDKKRSKKLSTEGVDESARSERGTIVCLHRWMSRSTSKGLRQRALEIEDVAQSTLGSMSKDEREQYTSDKLDSITRKMDMLSQKWFATPIGKYMEVKW